MSFTSGALVDGDEVAVAYLDGDVSRPYSITIPDEPGSTVSVVVTRAQAVSLFWQLRTAFRHDPNLHAGAFS